MHGRLNPLQLFRGQEVVLQLGVDVKETNRDPEVETTGRETMRLRSLITDALEKDAKDGGTSSGVLEEMQQGMDDSPDDVMDDSMQEEPVIEETQEDIPTGLMSKGNV